MLTLGWTQYHSSFGYFSSISLLFHSHSSPFFPWIPPSGARMQTMMMCWPMFFCFDCLFVCLFCAGRRGRVRRRRPRRRRGRPDGPDGIDRRQRRRGGPGRKHRRPFADSSLLFSFSTFRLWLFIFFCQWENNRSASYFFEFFSSIPLNRLGCCDRISEPLSIDESVGSVVRFIEPLMDLTSTSSTPFIGAVMASSSSSSSSSSIASALIVRTLAVRLFLDYSRPNGSRFFSIICALMARSIDFLSFFLSFFIRSL